MSENINFNDNNRKIYKYSFIYSSLCCYQLTNGYDSPPVPVVRGDNWRDAGAYKARNSGWLWAVVSRSGMERPVLELAQL